MPVGLEARRRWRGGPDNAAQRQSGGHLESWLRSPKRPFRVFRPGAEPATGAAPNAILAPCPTRQGAEFRRLGSACPGSDRMVIQNISFSLDHVDKLALISDNRAGKTTLVKLLARLYAATEGADSAGRKRPARIRGDDLRREFGVIFQDYMRYDLLVRENIGFGKVDALDNRLLVESAAVKSLAKGVIDRLPNGYDRVVGRRFEGGVDLSGGEWQKFALARAYMRDAQLLILDEPTATLDARAGYQVVQRFPELTRARMAVLISNRFSTVRMADRILVLADGSIREQGTRGNLENRKRKKTCPQEWGHGRRGRLRYKREKEDE